MEGVLKLQKVVYSLRMKNEITGFATYSMKVVRLLSLFAWENRTNHNKMPKVWLTFVQVHDAKE